MRRSLPGVAAVLLAFVLPSNALAAIRYVDDSGANAVGCTNSEAPCGSIGYAAEQASNGDTIAIDEGIYPEEVLTSKVLTFEGADPGSPGETEGATVVQGLEGTGGIGTAAFVLGNGGTLRNLQAIGGDGSDGSFPVPPAYPGSAAIRFPSGKGLAQMNLENVLAIGGDGGSFIFPEPGGAGLEMSASTSDTDLVAEDSAFLGGEGGIFFPAAGALIRGPTANAKFVESFFGGFSEPLSGGMEVTDGAEAVVDSTIFITAWGAAVSGGTLSVDRSFLLSLLFPLWVKGVEFGPPAEAEIANSVVFSSEAEAAGVGTIPGGPSATLAARGTSFYTRGNYAAIAAQGDTTGDPVTVDLRNSIARIEPEPPDPEARDLVASGATITADFSSFSSVKTENSGSVPVPGSSQNIAGDPGFEEPGSFFLALKGDSPLIDEGDPSVVAPGELDLIGEPRSLDGNGDCIPVPDIGAIELTGQSAPCPAGPSTTPTPVVDAPPTVTGFGLTNKVFAPKGGSARASAIKRGTRFRYILSEAAKVAITIERKKAGLKNRRWRKVTTLSAQEGAGKQSTPFSGKVRGKALEPGRYRARIVATDSAGQKSQPRQLRFRIVAG